MIVVDTNVVSELMRPRPSQPVVDWVNELAGDELFTTSITVAEILFGMARLPDGRRRDRLRARWDDILVSLGDRVLSFDVAAAGVHADIAAAREAAGRPIDASDGQIAAICRLNDATLATRNVRDFEETGLELVDPFG